MKSNRRELAAVNAVQARQDRVQAAETNRDTWWHVLPLVERQRAVSVAGLDKARAIMPVASFSDAERARIRFALEAHMMNMGLILRCMAPSNTNEHGFLH